jgi:RND family efflux transporter MFP subunit
MRKIVINKKNALIAGGALVVLFLGWRIARAVFPGASGPGGPGGVAVAVEIGPVEKSPIRDLSQFSGTLIAKSNVTVAPKVPGKLNRLLVDIGDPVTNGQLVAVLEDEEYQQQLIQAEADLRVARANLEEAKSSLEMSGRDLERSKTLHEKGIQSDSQLDAVVAQHGTQQARYNVAVAQLANRESALEAARLRLSYTQIRASWQTGSPVRYVGERFVDQGALLSVNTPILSIVELQPITAVIHVTDKDYFRLKPDQPAVVTSGAFPERSFGGQVVRIAPLLKETSRQARVEIEIDNPDKLLKPGMFINAQIEFARRDSVTVVPFNAVANRDGQSGVFVVDFGTRTARFQPIQIGIVEGERVEILEPASLSGYVVTLGHYLLEKEGAVILPPTAPGVKS